MKQKKSFLLLTVAVLLSTVLCKGQTAKNDQSCNNIVNEPSQYYGGMQLHIKTTSGKSITIEVDKNASILRVKDTIFRKTGLSKSQQILIYGGKQLDDGLSLSDYGIEPNSTVHLVIRIA